MKETLIGIGICVIIIIVYINLPLKIRRHKDIDLGNHIITQIYNYQKQHGSLPNNNDEFVFKQLGMRYHNDIGWQPNYQKINANQFRIIYKDGFVPPYLTWDKQNPQWRLQSN